MFLFDFLLVLFCGAAGLVLGWLMHATYGQEGNWRPGANRRARRDLGGLQSAPMLLAAEVEVEQLQREQWVTRNVAKQLTQYAAVIANNVDTLQTRVQAVVKRLDQSYDPTHDDLSDAIQEVISASSGIQFRLQEAQQFIREQSVRVESVSDGHEIDDLTRIPTRGAFDHYVRERFELGFAAKTTMALIDIDDFRAVNETHGKLAGDEVLRVVAAILSSRLGRYGHVARYGGVEFGIVLDDCGAEEAAEIIETVRAHIGKREILFEDKKLSVTASAGIVEMDSDESIENWIERAERTLYKSKDEGRNQGHWMQGKQTVRCVCQSSCDDKGTEDDPSSSDESAEMDLAGDSAVKGGDDAATDAVGKTSPAEVPVG